ncbi:MAG: hypothetical protein NWF02_01100 [Candidatus Bathyarchaeota archaeon]|nr:hypothetical protein [Candidatus Bathyarchaeum sp.]
MSWLRPDLPDELLQFMKMGYPAIKTIEENLDIAKRCGYTIVNSFVLPAKSWWDNYYNLIKAKLPALKTKYKDDKERLKYINCEDTEMEIFRKYSDYYGYVFYVMQNK